MMINPGAEFSEPKSNVEETFIPDTLAGALASEEPVAEQEETFMLDILAVALASLDPISEEAELEEIPSPTFDAVATPQKGTSEISPDNDDTKRQDRVNALRRFVGFTIVRQSANLEWAAGITGGEAAIQTFGTNRWATAAAVAGSVALLENKQSKWAANRIKKSGEELVAGKNIRTSFGEVIEAVSGKSEAAEDAKSSKAKQVIKATARLMNAVYKEISVLASASWQGAAATVEVNHTHGLESTPARIKAQSLTFGAAVGMWLTPIPPFKQLNGVAREAFDYILDNPIQSTSAGAGFSVGIYGILNGYKALKNKLTGRRTKTDAIDEKANK